MIPAETLQFRMPHEAEVPRPRTGRPAARAPASLAVRCPLKGSLGDALHAVLCGCGHNIRLILAYLRALVAENPEALPPRHRRCELPPVRPDSLA